MENNFCILDYDCIGFDLDNTLLQYNEREMSRMIYQILSKFLVHERGYNNSLLLKNYDEGIGFVQKGLVMDFDRGNVVKLNKAGAVIKAFHGEKALSDEDINTSYGPEKKWDKAKEYISDILKAWNNRINDNLRCVLDYFDAPCTLLFARIVDVIDQDPSCDKKYKDVWPNMVDGLNYMYDKEGFSQDVGEYFPTIKADPTRYIKKCSKMITTWLKQLRKENKLLYLITGSAPDFANFTSTFAMGENWYDLFDLVVFFARKPAFFTERRPFYKVEHFEETKQCTLTVDDKFVSQGNWADLRDILSKRLGKSQVRCIYIGDNAVQDVLAPVSSGCCDAIAVCPEVVGDTSSCWGPYVSGQGDDITLWMEILSKYSKLCVPSIECLAKNNIATRYDKKCIVNKSC